MDNLTCTICFENFNHSSLNTSRACLSSCQHLICHGCIQEILKSERNFNTDEKLSYVALTGKKGNIRKTITSPQPFKAPKCPVCQVTFRRYYVLNQEFNNLPYIWRCPDLINTHSQDFLLGLYKSFIRNFDYTGFKTFVSKDQARPHQRTEFSRVIEGKSANLKSVQEGSGKTSRTEEILNAVEALDFFFQIDKDNSHLKLDKGGKKYRKDMATILKHVFVDTVLSQAERERVAEQTKKVEDLRLSALKKEREETERLHQIARGKLAKVEDKSKNNKNKNKVAARGAGKNVDRREQELQRENEVFRQEQLRIQRHHQQQQEQEQRERQRKEMQQQHQEQRANRDTTWTNRLAALVGNQQPNQQQQQSQVVRPWMRNHQHQNSNASNANNTNNNNMMMMMAPQQQQQQQQAVPPTSYSNLQAHNYYTSLVANNNHNTNANHYSQLSATQQRHHNFYQANPSFNQQPNYSQMQPQRQQHQLEQEQERARLLQQYNNNNNGNQQQQLQIQYHQAQQQTDDNNNNAAYLQQLLQHASQQQMMRYRQQHIQHQQQRYQQQQQQNYQYQSYNQQQYHQQQPQFSFRQ